MSFIYFYLLILIHPYLAMWWKSFPQAKRQSWEALIPGYNYYVAFQITCKKPWWSLLLIFPGVHLVMLAVVNVSYIRRFGYYSLLDTLQGIFFPYLIMYKIAQSKQDFLPETNWANSKETTVRAWGDQLVLFLALPIIGNLIALAFQMITREKPGSKSKAKEWGDSLWFALVAASIIRTYVFEPFQIPTGSMEKTLLVGDFLFVNKLAYGSRVPVTPLSYPLVHNTVPWINIKSYTTLEKGTYTRIPGFGHVNRNDVVVFNYPSGDTAVYDPRVPDGLMGHDYHGILIHEAELLFAESKPDFLTAKQHISDSLYQLLAKQNKIPNPQGIASYSYSAAITSITGKYADEFIKDFELWKSKARHVLADEKIAHKGDEIIKHYGLIYRPVDKRENYIKRCVGIPGDWIEIKKSILYVNNKKAFVAENQNLQYTVSNFINPGNNTMIERFGLEESRGDYSDNQDDAGTYTMNLTLSEIEKLKSAYPKIKFDLVLNNQYSDNALNKPTGIQLINNLECFPKDFYVNNTITDFTRFRIPKKGQTISLSKANIAWYRRIITAYEGHKLEEKKDGIYIDGKKVTSYKFAMNYYWMMGDNRYNSADSRIWGFVPEDHIVGKASLVWFSKSTDPTIGVRWNRVFNVIH